MALEENRDVEENIQKSRHASVMTDFEDIDDETNDTIRNQAKEFLKLVV